MHRFAVKFIERNVRTGEWQYGHGQNKLSALSRFLDISNYSHNGSFRLKCKYVCTCIMYVYELARLRIGITE